jgi:hypothetical protein
VAARCEPLTALFLQRRILGASAERQIRGLPTCGQIETSHSRAWRNCELCTPVARNLHPLLEAISQVLDRFIQHLVFSGADSGECWLYLYGRLQTDPL